MPRSDMYDPEGISAKKSGARMVVCETGGQRLHLQSETRHGRLLRLRRQTGEGGLSLFPGRVPKTR